LICDVPIKAHLFPNSFHPFSQNLNVISLDENGSVDEKSLSLPGIRCQIEFRLIQLHFLLLASLDMDGSRQQFRLWLAYRLNE